MDEEDMQELMESRKLVDTTEAMDLTGGTEAELTRQATEEYESESVLFFVLSDLGLTSSASVQ